MPLTLGKPFCAIFFALLMSVWLAPSYAFQRIYPTLDDLALEQQCISLDALKTVKSDGWHIEKESAFAYCNFGEIGVLLERLFSGTDTSAAQQRLWFISLKELVEDDAQALNLISPSLLETLKQSLVILPSQTNAKSHSAFPSCEQTHWHYDQVFNNNSHSLQSSSWPLITQLIYGAITVTCADKRWQNHYTHYLIQVLSTPEESEAQALNTTLLHQDLPSKVIVKQLADGRWFYRVLVGPYKDGKKAREINESLTGKGLQGILRKESAFDLNEEGAY